jgi:hypothetical protein
MIKLYLIRTRTAFTDVYVILSSHRTPLFAMVTTAIGERPFFIPKKTISRIFQVSWLLSQALLTLMTPVHAGLHTQSDIQVQPSELLFIRLVVFNRIDQRQMRAPWQAYWWSCRGSRLSISPSLHRMPVNQYKGMGGLWMPGAYHTGLLKLMRWP